MDESRMGIEWSGEYRPEWDDAPDEYVGAGVVGWGRSRRLGKFEGLGVKAYLGVQHVDPSVPGWRIVEAAQARFFVSVFVGGRCIALRTFGRMDEALDLLESVLSHE